MMDTDSCKRLWFRVLTQALIEAMKSYDFSYFDLYNGNFREVCYMAGIEPQEFIQKIQNKRSLKSFKQIRREGVLNKKNSELQESYYTQIAYEILK